MKENGPMWQGRTFHECASELEQISVNFRSAYLNNFGWGETRRTQVMADCSKRGVEVLRVLALSVRSDENFGLTSSNPKHPVGALKPKATPTEIFCTLQYYRPPYAALQDFQPLALREALNKIAHANPNHSSFFANVSNHDILLTGQNKGNTWIAVISLIDLCRVIKTLPDAQTSGR